MPILSRLRGVVEEKAAEGVLLFAGGLGFEVQVPLSTLARLPETGEETTLRTYLHLREGAVGLFGFATAEEQRLFELLLTVAGVGPRSPLNCLRRRQRPTASAGHWPEDRGPDCPRTSGSRW